MVTQSGNNNNGSSITKHTVGETGYTVDIGDLLFTPERDFLVKNNGQKVKVDDLKGKSIVLFMFPLDPNFLWGSDHPDLVDAYNGLLRMGRGVEFVLVPVQLDCPVQSPHQGFESQEAFFNHLFSTIPFPSIPFSDVAACGGRVMETFSAVGQPYWVLIDPTNKVVATQCSPMYLFKLYGGDELYPLTPDAIEACCQFKHRMKLISQWDQLLAYGDRDFLLSSNGDQVPISSLKNKVIGLYFCENVPNPPRMDLIKNVYEEAKSRGYDFEIVQINFHYHCFSAHNLGTDPAVEPCREDVSWLTVPFKDPSVRKLQRIFECSHDDYWEGDCLVIIDQREGLFFEFSGADIFKEYEVEAYPFTRNSIYETEYARQKREVMLQSLFPPGDASQLLGKRLLVLFANQSIHEFGRAYLSMLEAEYHKQLEEDKLEVVYVSTDWCESSFAEYNKEGMPWLVHPYSEDFARECSLKVFRTSSLLSRAAAAFDKDGELIAKVSGLGLNGNWRDNNRQFPFISPDLKKSIRGEVTFRCHLYKLYSYEPDDQMIAKRFL